MRKTLLLVTFFGVMVTLSCNKDDNGMNNNPSTLSTYSSMNEVFNLLRVQPKYVNVNGATGGSFYGNSGTRYVFPANCFQDAAGNPVTGTVQVEVTEYLKKGDMVFSKMLPVSDGNDLISAGEINVNGTVGGAKVYIKPGMFFKAYVPQSGTVPSGFQYFSGITPQDTSVSIVNWRAFVDSGMNRAMIFVKDTTKTKKDTLAFVCDSMKRINGDQYRNGSRSQTFNVNIAATGATINSGSDIRSYIFVDSVQSITSLGYSSNPTTISNVHFDKMDIHLVVYGLINNKFYGGVFATKPTTGSTYTVTLVEVSPTAFKGQLNNLTQ
jgi:hypothetical protein